MLPTPSPRCNTVLVLYHLSLIITSFDTYVSECFFSIYSTYWTSITDSPCCCFELHNRILYFRMHFKSVFKKSYPLLSVWCDALVPFRIHSALTLCASSANEKTHSLVVHTGVPFGLDNINCSVNSICYNVVLSRLRQLLPRLPTSLSIESHRWQYSQVCCWHCVYCCFKVIIWAYMACK